ncbi:hypothetical protein HU200_055875 [Digitaria exilis]|uniref:Uncharacterized protein n=1 Tax=Digitaria exilis TaxID=1010633 RepID=A0A835AH28_9POAL|nr:hypothetical protein HU200_055875 [Digitaria exilis]
MENHNVFLFSVILDLFSPLCELSPLSKLSA